MLFLLQATEKQQGGLTAIPNCIVAITDPQDPSRVLLPETEGQITVIGDNIMVGSVNLVIFLFQHKTTAATHSLLMTAHIFFFQL